VRLNENGQLVERIVIKIKVFENGKWEWKVRQRFLKEPRIKVHDFLRILDEMKVEIAKTEGISVIESSPSRIKHVEPPRKTNSKKKKNRKG
jgi:hypothetical protein